MKKLTLRIINKLLRILSLTGFSFKLSGQKTNYSELKFTHISDLIDDHFQFDPHHICKGTIGLALSLLNNRPALIIETGSSAWGTNSSKLFDLYVRNWGGEFHTVDIRINPLLSLYKESSTLSHFYCDDSVSFLEKWVKNNPGKKADLVYLDSWDLNFKDPIPSAMHGLSEFFAIMPALGKGSILIIDDTPSNFLNIDFLPSELKSAAETFHIKYGIMPGKGTLIEIFLSKQSNAKKVEHSYQLVYEFI